MKTVATLASLMLVNALAQDQTPADPPSDPQTPADPPADDQTPADPPADDQTPDDQTPADPPAEGAQAVLDALNDNDLSSLATALADPAQGDVVQALLDDEDGWTLFAPENSPLDAAAAGIEDPTDLTPIFQYHASADPFDPSSLESGGAAVIDTLYTEGDFTQVVIAMKGDDDTITIKSGADEDYTVTNPIEFGDNWVHAISGVLAIPSSPSEVASGLTDLSSLVQALTEADLVGDIDGASGITIFAPTNDAFQNANATADSDILTYHVVTQAIYSPKIESGKYATLQGDSLEIVVGDDGVTLVDGSDSTITVTDTDYLTSNGVIHFIDTVLTPSGQQDADDPDGDGDGTTDAGDAAALQVSFAAFLCILALL